MLKAVQQFQICSETNTEKEAMKTLKAIRDAGYDGIELCTFLISKMPPLVRLLVKASGMTIGRGGNLNWHTLIQKSGLTVVAIHDNLNEILKRPDTIAERAQSFGTDISVVTGLMRYDYSDLQSVLSLAKKLNKAGQLLLARGVRLLYHNHNCEFTRINGQYALQILLENTNPQYVNFEYDSYWVAETGCNPLSIMHLLKERMKLYHINDRGFRPSGVSRSIVKSDSMELGCGNMDLDALINTAKSYGVEGIILESHKNWAKKSPTTSLQISAEFLKRRGII